MRKKNEQPKSGWIKHGWKTIRSEEEHQESFDVLISNGFKWSSEWSTVILFEHQRWVRLCGSVFIHFCHTLPTIRSLKNRLNLNAPKRKAFHLPISLDLQGFVYCLFVTQGWLFWWMQQASMCWGRPPTQYIHLLSKKHTTKAEFFPFKSVSEKMSFE